MRAYAFLFVLIIVVLVIGPASAGKQPAGQTIPKYTVIPVILDDTISTRKNRTGDTFEVHSYGSNCGGFPSGTTFVGVLTVTPAQGEHPGTGSAKFTSAILPDQCKVQIEAVPSTAEGVKNECKTGGKSKGKAQKKGALLGAGVGAITNGFKGAVVGGAVGAAAGSATKGKGKDIEIKAGTKGYIVLTKPATIPPPKNK